MKEKISTKILKWIIVLGIVIAGGFVLATVSQSCSATLIKVHNSEGVDIKVDAEEGIEQDQEINVTTRAKESPLSKDSIK